VQCVQFVFVVPPLGGSQRNGPCKHRLKAGLQTSNNGLPNPPGRGTTNDPAFTRTQIVRRSRCDQSQHAMRNASHTHQSWWGSSLARFYSHHNAATSLRSGGPELRFWAN